MKLKIFFSVVTEVLKVLKSVECFHSGLTVFMNFSELLNSKFSPSSKLSFTFMKVFFFNVYGGSGRRWGHVR